jgi:hypothetical protein
VPEDSEEQTPGPTPGATVRFAMDRFHRSIDGIRGVLKAVKPHLAEETDG